jgi:hypothetical protein
VVDEEELITLAAEAEVAITTARMLPRANGMLLGVGEPTTKTNTTINRIKPTMAFPLGQASQASRLDQADNGFPPGSSRQWLSAWVKLLKLPAWVKPTMAFRLDQASQAFRLDQADNGFPPGSSFSSFPPGSSRQWLSALV